MKAKSLIFTAIALVLCAAGCKKEETPKVTPSLKVSGITDNTITVGSEGGSATFTVTANVDWSVSSTGTWVSVTPASTKISDGKETTTTVTVTILPSTDGKARSAELSVGADNVNLTPVKITVKQTEKIDIIFEADSYIFHFGSDAHYNIFKITANKSWAFKSINEDWITVEPESKDITFGTKTITDVKISVKKNETTDAREATLYVQCEGAEDLMLNISQESGSNSITIYDPDVKEISSAEFGYAGGIVPIVIDTDSETEPEVSLGADWLSFVTTEEFVPGEFWNASIVAEANPTTEAREGTVTFRVKGNEAVVKVKQAKGVNVALSVDNITYQTADITASPSSDDFKYYATLFMEKGYQEYINEGLSDEDILAVDVIESAKYYDVSVKYYLEVMLTSGEYTYEYSGLPEGTNYVALVAAMTEEGLVTSKATKLTFSTPTKPESDPDYTALIGTWKVKGNSVTYDSTTKTFNVTGTDDLSWTAVIDEGTVNESYSLSFPVKEEEVSVFSQSGKYDQFSMTYIPANGTNKASFSWDLFEYGDINWSFSTQSGSTFSGKLMWVPFYLEDQKIYKQEAFPFTWDEDAQQMKPTDPNWDKYFLANSIYNTDEQKIVSLYSFGQVKSMERVDGTLPVSKSNVNRANHSIFSNNKIEAFAPKKKFNCVERISDNYRIK